MKISLRIICFVLVSCIHMTVFADSPVVTAPNGNSYQRIDTSMTWSNAKTYCENLEGYLATLTSQPENDFVYSTVGIPQTDIWLGGTDEAVEGTWQWVTGETWAWTYWFPGNPDDNAAIGQDYLAFSGFDTLGRWDDAGLPSEDLERIFICEWDEPVTPIPSLTQWGTIILALLITGSAIWVLRRRKRVG